MFFFWHSPCFWGWRSAWNSPGLRCYRLSLRSPSASPRSRISGRTVTSWYRTANPRRDQPSSNWDPWSACTRLRLNSRRWAETLQSTPQQTWLISPCLEPSWHVLRRTFLVSGGFVLLGVQETFCCLYRLTGRRYRDPGRSSNQSYEVGGWWSIFKRREKKHPNWSALDGLMAPLECVCVYVVSDS